MFVIFQAIQEPIAPHCSLLSVLMKVRTRFLITTALPCRCAAV